MLLLFGDIRSIGPSYIIHTGRVALSNQLIFRKSSKGGWVIFNPKIYIADFWNFKQGFLSTKLIQKSNFWVQGIKKNQNKTYFEEGYSSLRDRLPYQIG